MGNKKLYTKYDYNDVIVIDENKFRSRAKEYGFSINEMALEFAVTPSTFYRWVSSNPKYAQYKMPRPIARHIAHILDCHPEDFEAKVPEVIEEEQPVAEQNDNVQEIVSAPDNEVLSQLVEAIKSMQETNAQCVFVMNAMVQSLTKNDIGNEARDNLLMNIKEDLGRLILAWES